MVATRLRLALSITSIRQRFGDDAIVPPTTAVDRFGILLQDGEFLLTQSQEFLVRQIADRNIILTQDGLELITQAGGNLVLHQSSLNLQEIDGTTGLGLSILTQSGGDILLNG
tara:strand:- start:298 stop:636 length:339 start_codon:yes stop_codon:yes gene_type:complete